MATIKINKEKLNEYAEIIATIKGKIDEILLQTVNTEFLLNTSCTVNAWSAKNSLEDTQKQATDLSILLGLISENFYEASLEYDIKEEELNNLINIDYQDVKKARKYSSIGAYLFNADKYLSTGFNGGLAFNYIKNSDGSINLKLRNTKSIKFNSSKSSLTNSEYIKIKNGLKNKIGGTNKWNKPFVTEMTVGDGVKIIDDKGNYIKSSANKFRNSKFAALSKSVDDISILAGKSKIKTFIKVGQKSVKDSIKGLNPKSIKDAKGFLGKGGKVLGIAGTAFTVYDNFNSELKDENGNVDLLGENRVQEFAVGTSVDLAAGFGTAAAGAAIGSIIPGVGTVVGGIIGFGVGVALNWAANKDWTGEGSVVNKVKDGINDSIDSAQDKIGEVGEFLGDLIW